MTDNPQTPDLTITHETPHHPLINSGEFVTGLGAKRNYGHRSLEYRPDIDGLRGIAVLLVLVFHFDLFNIGKAGFIGVDVFFVISGYLISKIIWSGFDSHSFIFLQFYIRRIRRLAPPLVATLAITLGVGAIVLLPQELVSLSKEAIAAQLYGSNFYYWRTLNYFGLQVVNSFLLHTWSLAVEEQFYLFFPLLLFVLDRIFSKRRVALIVVLAAASFSLNLLMVGAKPEATFYLLPTRAWELLIGAMLAAVELRLPKSSNYKLTAGILGLGLLGIALLTHSPATPFPGTFALLPVFSAVLLLFAGSDRDGAAGRALAFWPLRYVGIISYSLYLVHWPIKVFLPLLVFEFSTLWRFFGFVLSFLIATLMYFLVERPSKTAITLRSAKGLLVAYAISTAALIAIFGSAWWSGGWRERFEPNVVSLADASEDKDERTQQCTLAQAEATPACHLGKVGQPATWLILGDSHAQALSGAFDQWLSRRGEAGLLVFQHGCAPVYGMGNAECQGYVKSVRELWKSPAIENVFLVSIWRPGLENGFVDDKGRYVGPEGAPQYFTEKFSDIVGAITADGRHAFLWMPLPPARKVVPFSLARSELFGLNWEIGRERKDFEEEYKSVLDTFSAQAGKLSGVADPAKAMCSTGTCITFQNGRPIYFDNNHPAASQKDYFSGILTDQIGDISK